MSAGLHVPVSGLTALPLLVLFIVGAGRGQAATGQVSCAKCHAKESAAQPGSPMGHAMEPVADCAILKSHPLLTFRSGKYAYRIERKGNQSFYSVSDGDHTITVRVGWAFGLGQAGQTYVFEREGRLYESQVSYYAATGALDLTMGAINQAPRDLAQAAGREMGKQDGAQCFHCHATASGEGLHLDLAGMTPGIHCERCHGSAEAHAAGFESGQTVAMKRMTDGSAEQGNTFCGQCHRTWDEIATGPKLGVANVRFQAYRITNSKCYDSDDRRISCVTCHDPHQPLNRVSASYDGKCTACHSPGGKAGAAACKTGTKDCASCHMPRIDMPGAHHRFTDHQIRIVRANEPYPE